ncbi:LruC domain-containing protein [Pseudoalteromonas tunicata]|uniref:LruC domain-containing protein n=1 Tax=Pseudoalteromonas tunicata TaxID=314281 RepID=UPI00273DAB3E|nr:LruC domain-containing protein [Pseudoalteromonas tunicata]MDP4985547.1 LruC domain-containing protein [Pseudoalteromonas tunicata]
MKRILTGAFVIFSGWVCAVPFDSCPSKAFLVQQNVAVLYGVNLASGSANILASNMGTNNKINGFGFSVHDRYLYGWGYENRSLIRIGKDFQMQNLATVGLPDTDFFVGDVSVLTNDYYAYRKGNGYGLYRVPLDANQSDYLQATKVIDGGLLNLNIFDLAFHPTTDAAYSVDSNGNLYQINASTGQASSLGNVGERGTFGAVYFDVNGNFYISRNTDGYIFRINVMAAEPVAEFFAFGPSSNNNDGARCATAPIIDEDDTSLDFGDAPASYRTSLADNGARHQINPQGLFLGASVNGEAVEKVTDDSDDGVQFVTALESGFDALLIITASQAGYLNAWFDWDQNGVFDNNEQLITSQALQAGANAIKISVPDTVVEGQSWARFRITRGAVISAWGGVSDGEVEDYPINLIDSGITRSYYPSANSWVSLAYEDLWPEKGDYDFNDVVVNYRTIIDRRAGQVVRYVIEGQLVALGASYHNGFAVRLKGVAPSDINEALIHHQIGSKVLVNSPLEANRSEAIIQIMADTKNWVPSNSCRFYRTESGCGSVPVVNFQVKIPLNAPIDSTRAPTGVLDPFIFAVNGQNHGPFVNANNARSWEVHLKNQAPTEAFDTSLFGQGDDNSLPSSGYFYQTTSGLPWALELGQRWDHPKEYVDLLQAYPGFEAYTLSNGIDQPMWFMTANASNTITNQ